MTKRRYIGVDQMWSDGKRKGYLIGGVGHDVLQFVELPDHKLTEFSGRYFLRKFHPMRRRYRGPFANEAKRGA